MNPQGDQATLTLDLADTFDPPAASDWREGTWACLDIERTGLEADDRICEIAIVRMQGGAVLSTVSSLVHPGREIPADATGIHGITNEMVAGAPKIGDLRDRIADAIKGCDAIVAYNGYGADFDWLEAELPGLIGGMAQIDPLPIVRSAQVGKYWKSDYQPPHECPICDEDKPVRAPQRRSAGRHKLSRAAEILDCAHAEPGFEAQLHRAGWDALLAGRVLWMVCRWCSADALVCEERLRAESARQRAELDAFMARMRGEDEERRKRRKQSLAYRVGELETYIARLHEQYGLPAFTGECRP